MKERLFGENIREAIRILRGHKMEGKQKLVHRAILEMASKNLRGDYGENNDFDVELWREDLDRLSCTLRMRAPSLSSTGFCNDNNVLCQIKEV